MPSFSTLTAAAVLAMGAAAAPQNLERRGGFSVAQVQNPKYTGPAPGAYQVYRTQAKYNKAGVPAPVLAAAAAVTTGSTTANPQQYDSEYLEPVKIGTQTFQLDFDTGSSDLWVFGSALKSSGGSHTYYTPGSTAKLLSGETWTISYGDGSSASGTVYTDTVSVGTTTVVGQDVEAANKASSAFTSGSDDGLLGLAFDSINTCSPNQCTTFFTNAVAGGLPKALFTANLNYEAVGQYDFGYLDSSQYTSAITYTPVDSSEGFWMFTPSGYAVGTAAVVSASSSVMTGIADTGTTLLYADPSIVKAYWSKVSGAKSSSSAGGYVFPCSATLPNFTLVINGYKAVVPGKYMNYSPYSGSTCFGGIQSNTGIGFSIYGDIFLKSQFVVFDQTTSTPRLGFAAKKTT